VQKAADAQARFIGMKLGGLFDRLLKSLVKGLQARGGGDNRLLDGGFAHALS
jgi:hypothetical protein